MSGTPMMVRSLSNSRDSKRDTCIWLVPISSAISDWERCSKNRSWISRRSSSSSCARATSMINRASVRSMSSSVSFEQKQIPRDIAASIEEAL